ncbi:hypothetical protein ACSO1_06930 [Acinetobacter calcoaceticus]|nr:hypothetical protein ACSO1_06930 [Acinetobacter calcoaceticus]
MSIFSESKILIEIIKIIAPFFLKIRQDINVYKELLELEDNSSEKIKLRIRSKTWLYRMPHKVINLTMNQF